METAGAERQRRLRREDTVAMRLRNSGSPSLAESINRCLDVAVDASQSGWARGCVDLGGSQRVERAAFWAKGSKSEEAT